MSFVGYTSPCGYCSHILSGLVVRHTILECQYRQSMYCSVCMAYGHVPKDCPNKRSWAIRRGEDPRNIKNNVIVLEESEESVKEFLKARGVKPGTRILENRKLLRNLANSLNPPVLIQFRSVK